MIELYHAERCPYCVKVRLFLEGAGVAYISKPVPLGGATSPLKEELRSLGGKTQVPFLVDQENNVKMYESDDIIAYVKEHILSAKVSQASGQEASSVQACELPKR